MQESVSVHAIGTKKGVPYGVLKQHLNNLLTC